MKKLISIFLALTLIICNFNVVDVSFADEIYDDFKYSIDNSNITITDYTGSAENLVLPDEINGMRVIAIKDLAFANSESLITVEIPDSIISIGESAFWGCTNLATVKLPNNLTTIKASLFSECISLKDITIPDSVTTIGKSAFYKCTSLKNIDIPNSVTTI
ncbi:leucine-rich repeat domain-containing protein, partial [Intestinibacter sp.]